MPSFAQCFDVALAEQRQPAEITEGHLIGRLSGNGPVTLDNRERDALLNILLAAGWVPGTYMDGR